VLLDNKEKKIEIHKQNRIKQLHRTPKTQPKTRTSSRHSQSREISAPQLKGFANTMKRTWVEDFSKGAASSNFTTLMLATQPTRRWKQPAEQLNKRPTEESLVPHMERVSFNKGT
jgi:hypothetical protein